MEKWVWNEAAMNWDNWVEIVYSVWIENQHTVGMDIAELARRSRASERASERESLKQNTWCLIHWGTPCGRCFSCQLAQVNTAGGISVDWTQKSTLCALECVCVCADFSTLFSFRIELSLFNARKCKYFENGSQHTISAYATAILIIWTHPTAEVSTMIFGYVLNQFSF